MTSTTTIRPWRVEVLLRRNDHPGWRWARLGESDAYPTGYDFTTEADAQAEADRYTGDYGSETRVVSE